MLNVLNIFSITDFRLFTFIKKKLVKKPTFIITLKDYSKINSCLIIRFLPERD